MKKIALITGFLLLGFAPLQKACAQEVLEQLFLDIIKLGQLKDILKEMDDGYQILLKGYNTVKELSEGSFNLHKLFLDGLLSVSPTVKKYQRIVQIIADEQTLLNEYHSALTKFSLSSAFSSGEMAYMQTVYTTVFNGSANNLTALTMVITDGTLRMNDAERLNAIDHIYADMEDKVDFMRSFDNNANIMSLQRQSDLNETGHLQSLYGIQK